MSSPFDIKSTVRNEFAPRKGYMNKREQFLAYVHQNGWMLDTDQQIKIRVGGEYVLRQHPMAFVRPSPTGRDWHMMLDYNVYGTGSRADNILRGIDIWRGVEDGERRKLIRLRPARTYGYTALWDVTGKGLEPGWRDVALRPRAERLVADPDLAMWLEAEQSWINAEAHRVASEKRQAEWEKRKRPLQNVTVKRSVWDSRANAIRDAAWKLQRADGCSDITKLMATLREAVAELESAVSPNTTEEK